MWQVEPSDGDNRVGTMSFDLMNSNTPGAGFPCEIFGYVNRFFLFFLKPLAAKTGLTTWRVSLGVRRGGKDLLGTESREPDDLIGWIWRVWENEKTEVKSEVIGIVHDAFNPRKDMVDEDAIFPFAYPIRIEKHI